MVEYIVAPIITFIVGYYLKGWLDRRKIKILKATVTPLFYNLMTAGWTESQEGIPYVHSYRIRIVLKNPGYVNATLLDIVLTWHLRLDAKWTESDKMIKISSLINVPSNNSIEFIHVVEIPTYYTLTKEEDPFTITYRSETGTIHEIAYTMNTARRKKPTHVGEFYNPPEHFDILPDDDDVD